MRPLLLAFLLLLSPLGCTRDAGQGGTSAGAPEPATTPQDSAAASASASPSEEPAPEPVAAEPAGRPGEHTLAGSGALDPALPEYDPLPDVAGLMSSIGSDTMSNLMMLWAMGFRGVYHDVQIEVRGAGSATGPAALTAGEATFAPMSRAMTSAELEAFEERHGYPPTIVCGAVDALAIYVHRDNPLPRITIPEIDSIFSSTRNCGQPVPVTRWAQLEVGGRWADLDIVAHSRNQISGTYEYFRTFALCGGEFAEANVIHHSSARLVAEVGASIDAIGFSGIGYATSGVRAVPVATDEGTEAFEATAENAASRDYPLARFLCVYVNRHPEQGLPLAEREFLRFILSRPGQELVEREGFVPLPAHLVERQRRELGLD